MMTPDILVCENCETTRNVAGETTRTEKWKPTASTSTNGRDVDVYVRYASGWLEDRQSGAAFCPVCALGDENAAANGMTLIHRSEIV